MKRIMKSFLVVAIATISFVGFNEAKAQFQIEAMVYSPCSYYTVQLFWGYGVNTCSMTTDEYVKVLTGDNFYYPPAPGMIVKAVEIIDNGMGGSGGLVCYPASCLTQVNSFDDCANVGRTAVMTSHYYMAMY